MRARAARRCALIIARYTREAGVRDLERTIGRVARKVARQFAEGHDGAVIVGPDDLTDLLGPERIRPERPRGRAARRRRDRAGLDRGRRRRAVHRGGPAARPARACG